MFPLKDNIPREHPPFVTLALIALTVVLHLISLPHGAGFLGLLLILANVLLLALFGPSVEDSMGHARYVTFCLLGGLVALATQSAVHTGSATPALAACGATAAVLGGYVAMYSHARVLTVIFVVFFATLVELPALLLLGLLFLGQLYLGAYALAIPAGAGGGLAYLAQALGGFACGAVLISAFARHRRSVPPRHPVY